MDQSKENASQYSDEQKATFIKLLIKYLIENFRFPGTYIEDRSFWDHVHSKLQDSNEAPDSCCTSLTGWVKKDWKMKTKWNELNPVRRQCLLTSAIFNKAQLSQTDEPIIQRLEGIVGAFLMAEHLKFFEFQAFCIGMLCGLTPPETEISEEAGMDNGIKNLRNLITNLYGEELYKSTRKLDSDELKQLKNEVVNLSSKKLTTTETKVLARGMDFVITPEKIPIEEIITEVEVAVKALSEEEAEKVRKDVSRVLTESKIPTQNITKEEKVALENLEKDDSIVITKADKGNATVVLSKDSYNEKIWNLLNHKTYTRLIKDPTDDVATKVKELLNKSPFSEKEKARMKPKLGRPKLYGLPNIHKEGIPLRLMVNSIGSPTYDLAKYLATLLKPSVGKTTSYVENTEHFIKLLTNLTTDAGDILVRFNVPSLFTNIPRNDVMEIINNLGLPTNTANLVELCLSTSYFLWDDSYFEQRSGTAIGSPLSPMIANLFMEAFEKKAIEGSELKPKCWLRHVDETFVIWQHGKEELQEFFKHINKQHQSIKFTMEIEGKERLPYIGVMVYRTESGKIQHAVYREETHTDGYLHASSHHPPEQKTAFIKKLMHRAETISDVEHLKEEKRHVEETLKKNGYSDAEIRSALRMPTAETPQTETKPIGVVRLPYIASVSEEIASILIKNNIKVKFTVTSIQHKFSVTKDKVLSTEEEGVYKIMCTGGKEDECKEFYIGQTGRPIIERIQEHEFHTTYKKIQTSAIAEHVYVKSHKMDFEKPVVLAATKDKARRKIRESIEIAKHGKSLNRQSSTLKDTWKNLLIQEAHPHEE